MRSRIWYVLAAGLMLLSMAGVAQAGREDDLVTVTGRGEVQVRPDVARLSIGVTRFAPMVEQAMDAESTSMEAVLAELRRLGVAESDIRTSNYSIQLERPHGRESQEPVQEQYRVNNTVQVRIRDLEASGRILRAVVAAGANDIGGIRFVVDKPDSVAGEARRLAVAQARSRALELAELCGRKLGRAIRIREIAGRYAEPMGGRMLAAAAPIRPGETAISVQVEVTYQLR